MAALPAARHVRLPMRARRYPSQEEILIVFGPWRARSAAKLSNEQMMSRHFDVIINATPVGMWPHVDECPFPDVIPGEIVFDMVYNPLETLLIRRAKEQGKQVIPGLTMFLEQAARQFEAFTGENAPRAAMQTAAMDALETRYSEQKA